MGLAAACVVAGGCVADDSGPSRAVLAQILASGFAAELELAETTDRLNRSCMEQKGFLVHPDAPEGSGRISPRYESPNIEIAMTARRIINEDRVRMIGYGRSPAEMLGFDPSGVATVTSPFGLLSRMEQNQYWLTYQGYLPDEVPDRGGPVVDGGDRKVQPPNQEEFTLPNGEKVSYPREGCVADIQRQLFDGKVREFHELTYYSREGIGKAAIGEVRGDPAVREVNRKWSECMRRKGYPGLREPLDAENKASSSYGAKVFGPDSPGYTELKDQEIALAVADYGCNHEVGLDETRVRVFWRNVAAFYQDRQAEIAAWSEMVEDAKVMSQQLLAG
ncbi:hypothetical protein [Micromonospora sp. LOL_015]|uniref:hypothetical protein n=1 Tax=Micromonospora sp. LOL_015 TaxID=3345416 RepID=UPI003A87B58D